jgi:hypothetical protein
MNESLVTELKAGFGELYFTNNEFNSLTALELSKHISKYYLTLR